MSWYTPAGDYELNEVFSDLEIRSGPPQRRRHKRRRAIGNIIIKIDPVLAAVQPGS
jgi:hypothetical protein